MEFKFTDTKNHGFREGMIYLGRDDKGREIGIDTEINAMGFAKAGSGKGAALIIPNMKRWPGNALVIDPKGGTAKETWQDRQRFGQTVGILDPLRALKPDDIPENLRVSVNLLDSIDPDSLTAREDCRVIADGLVMRHNPKNAEWQDMQIDLLAGLVAHVVTTGDADHRTLLDVREILLLPDDALRGVFTEMLDNRACGGLARAGGLIGLSSLDTQAKQSPEGGAISGARTNTKWLDSPGMAAVLGSSTFDISLLKTGAATLFLVLPPKYLNEHGRFLRLFVRCALNISMSDLRGPRCLFIMDEFASLGHIDEIRAAMSTAREYNLHLWPIMQDIPQLFNLYGREGAGTFFANSDINLFFGNHDAETLSFISSAIGVLTMAEIGAPPTHVRSAPMSGHGVASFMSAGSTNRHAVQSAHATGALFAGAMNGLSALGDWAAQKEANDWQVKASQVGKSRLPPEKVRELVAKKDGDKVARRMIVFGKGNDVFNLRLAPFFEVEQPIAQQSKDRRYWLDDYIRGLGAKGFIGVVVLPWLIAAFLDFAEGATVFAFLISVNGFWIFFAPWVKERFRAASNRT